MEGWNDRADCEKAGAGLGGAPRRQPSFHRDVEVNLAVGAVITQEASVVQFKVFPLIQLFVCCQKPGAPDIPEGQGQAFKASGVGEYGVLPAFQDFGDKGRRKVFKGGDLHRSNLREQHIIIHGIHAVAIFTCLADSKAAAGRECVGNQVHLGAEGIPQSGDYIVPKSGEAAQSGCFYIRKFQDPGVDSQVVRQGAVG